VHFERVCPFEQQQDSLAITLAWTRVIVFKEARPIACGLLAMAKYPTLRSRHGNENAKKSSLAEAFLTILAERVSALLSYEKTDIF
jgi:hypothetical protein